MKRSIILLAAMIICMTHVYGQRTKSKVVLKSGVHLRGEIVEFVQNEYMIMSVVDGQDLRIPANVIRSFKIKKGKLSTYNLPQQGYFNHTTAGFLFTKADRFDWVHTNMTIHTINGYRYNEFYSGGIGVGLDRYGSISSLPVYVAIRRDLFANKVTPMINTNFGYGWMWESDSFNEWDDFETVRGGIYWEIGAGLRINYRKTAFIINYGYKRQNSELTYFNNWWWGGENWVEEKRKFRNMTLTVGMEF